MSTHQPTEPMDNSQPRLTLAKLDELINAVEGGATVLWTAYGEIPLGITVEQMTDYQLAAAKALAVNNSINWDKLKERLERPLPEPLNKPMDTTPRDPHLPPPVVCDWLLEQEWSERISSIKMSFPENRPLDTSHSEMNGYHVADIAIGRDETARLFMPDDALDALRDDHAIRRSARL